MQLSKNRRKSKKIIINITSLIDVVLLLLIFFMLTSTFMEESGMELELPETESGESEAKAEIEISLDSTNNLQLNGEEIEFDQLDTRLQGLAVEHSEKTLLLKADKNVSHGDVMDIMDLAKKAGLQKIVIITKQK